MTLKKLILAVALFVGAGLAHAQITATHVLTEAAALPVVTGTDIDPRGIAATPDGSALFFYDTRATNGDYIAKYDGTTVTLHTTRAQLLAAEPLATNIVDLDDLVAGPDGTLYAVVRYNVPGDTNLEYLIRIPPAGSPVAVMVAGGVGSPTLGTNGNELQIVEYDLINNRLLLYKDDGFVVGTPTGIYTVAPNVTSGTLTTFTTSAVMVNGISTAVVAEVGVSDFTQLTDGSIVCINAFGTGDGVQDGDLFRISADGLTATPLSDRLPLLTAMGGTATGFGDSFIESNSLDEIFLYQTGNAAPGENIIKLTSAGALPASPTQPPALITEAIMLTATASADTDISTTANGMALVNNRIYITNTATDEGILSFAGPDVPVELSAFELL